MKISVIFIGDRVTGLAIQTALLFTFTIVGHAKFRQIKRVKMCVA